MWHLMRKKKWLGRILRTNEEKTPFMGGLS